MEASHMNRSARLAQIKYRKTAVGKAAMKRWRVKRKKMLRLYGRTS
jgi:hypothetical protein